MKTELQTNQHLIQEFMGVEKTERLIPYHSCWNHLMLVVEKIEELGYSYDRINADVFINTQEDENIIPNPMDYNTMTMLEKTYQVVVEFI